MRDEKTGTAHNMCKSQPTTPKFHTQTIYKRESTKLLCNQAQFYFFVCLLWYLEFGIGGCHSCTCTAKGELFLDHLASGFRIRSPPLPTHYGYGWYKNLESLELEATSISRVFVIDTMIISAILRGCVSLA